MIKVGRDFIDGLNPPKFDYRHIKFDQEGWADAKEYLPADYDLVFMKLKRGPIIAGWSYANGFVGLRMKSADKVIFWKRKPDEKYI